MTEPVAPAAATSGPFVRPLPALDDDNRAFWTGGADGSLHLRRCTTCSQLQHPPAGVCGVCHHDRFEVVTLSGRGTVTGVTVNLHPWIPSFPDRYALAIVAIEEDPSVRITTNVVRCPPEDVFVGMPVEVLFEQHDDVWLPLFRPTADADPAHPLPLPADPPVAPLIRPMVSTEKFEDEVALTGVGRSAIGRRLRRHPMSLAVEASLAAVDDAGLTLDDIDGLSLYPGLNHLQFLGAGHSEGGVFATEDALRIRPTWINGGPELNGQTGAIITAMLAVAAGLCRHVLCIRTVWESTDLAQRRERGVEIGGLYGGDLTSRVDGDLSWRFPYGAVGAASWIALHASHHFATFGTTRESLGWIALNARRNAALNERAVYRDPLTMDDYLSARMITTPFGLYDCDVPCDGAIAVIVSARDTAPDARHAPVFVDAVGTQIAERVSWDQGTMEHEPLVDGPSAHLWTRTLLTPGDVDTAQLYDGFTFNCLSWIEALGFCGRGEAKDFLEGGTRIALEGELPLNTDGGQLSAGRLHGFNFVAEAMDQLRGACGARQVADAEVAVVSTGGGEPGSAMLLTKSR